MFERREYYTLIASFPRLMHFDEAERLPINLERMKERLKMLVSDDAKMIKLIVSFIVWWRQPVEKSDAEIIADHERFLRVVDDPLVREMVEVRVDIRTILVALRRRMSGTPAPKAGEKWGAGRWVRHIEQNWDDPNFKLATIYPWLPQVRDHLESGNALALERLLFNLVWDGVDRFKEEVFFGFDVVLAYLFKWDIAQRWLAYDVEAARARFDELVAEALNEQER